MVYFNFTIAGGCIKPTIDSSTVSPDTATIAEGAKYTVSCDSDYILNGESEVTCGSDRKLSTLPTCYSSKYFSCSVAYEFSISNAYRKNSGILRD